MAWTIVKVGGSLYDWPELGERLRQWLADLDVERVLLVPGGGATADAIRAFDKVHHLGEEVSHWLAIRALSLNARFLHALVRADSLVATREDLRTAIQGLHVLDAVPFFMEDEGMPKRLPHHWNVTSDSLSARVTAIAKARELILLKSVDAPLGDWARSGIVDGYFADVLKQLPDQTTTRIVNLRSWTLTESR